jgi:hypothetical protein
VYSITISNQEAADVALGTIRELASPKEDGTWKITISPMETFARELLVNLVQVKPEIPDRTLRGLVYSSIFKWLRFKKYREDRKPYRGFHGALLREMRRLERKRADYHVLMFISCKADDLEEFYNLALAGSQLIITDWDQLDPLDVGQFWQTIIFHRLAPSLFHDFGDDSHFQRRLDFTPVVVSMNTFGPAAAVELAQNAFDLFRVCLNLPVISGHFSYFRSTPKALSPILPTPVYGVFAGDGHFKTVFTTIEKYEYKRVKISSKHASAAKSYLEKVNRISSKDIGGRVVRLLRLYQDAIDIHSPRQSYLALWHVLEGIADIEASEIQQREIEKRVTTLLHPDPVTKQLLHVLVDRRNKLVHTGDFPDDPDRLYFALKLIVDAALYELLQLAERLETPHHLDEFLSMASLGDTVLERKLDVIQYIRESRQK